MHFNKSLSHGKRNVLVADLNPKINQEDYDTAIANIMTGKIDYTDLHNILGHANKTVTKSLVKRLKVKITGVHDDIKCSDCSLAKLRTRNFGTSTDPTTEPGEKMSIDISSVKNISYGGSKFWSIIQIIMELFPISQK
jgi:hypothetical protein